MASRMTVSRKLMLCFGTMLGFAVALGYAYRSSVRALSGELETAVHQTTRKGELVGKVQTAIAAMRAGQRGVILFSMLKLPGNVQSSAEAFAKAADEARTSIVEIRPLLSTDEGRQSVDRIERDLGEWLPVYKHIADEAASGRFDGAMLSDMDRTLALAGQVQQAAEELERAQRAALTASARKAQSVKGLSDSISLGLITLSMVAGGFVLWLVRGIARRLQELAGELSQGAAQVAGAAAQVSSSSQSLAQGASEQASSIAETAASADEIQSMARKNGDNSQRTTALVLESQAKFSGANRVLEEMIVATNDINAASDKIAKIIQVIDEIAFQTNILALNAAVEAARAGQAGMGFAVVADEVRNLAQRSATAAKDTAALIEASISKSHEGKTKVQEMAAALRALTAESAQVKTLVEEVEVGSKEQANGIEQIGAAIVQMEKVTQSSAAGAEQSAAAAEQLTAHSAALKSLADRLTDMVGSEANLTDAGRVVSKAAPAVRPAAKGLKRAPLKRPVSKAPEKGTGRLAARAIDRRELPLDNRDFTAF